MASRRTLESIFPRLKGSKYRRTSPESLFYNCVAWAAGNTTHNWWPDSFSYWIGPSTEETVASFAAAFTRLGYEPCENISLEEGMEKVAIYAKDGEVQHMARQTLSGAWTSKLGELDDIQHELSALEGQEYGSVALVLRRKTRNE